MDTLLAENNSLNQTVIEAHASLNAASHLELLVAVLVPLLALFLSLGARRLLSHQPQERAWVQLATGFGSLFAPFLSLIGAAIALSVHKKLGLEIAILPFVFKLSLSWFAIQLVRLMSSSRSAWWVIACIVLPATILHLFGLWNVTIDALSAISFTVGKTEISLYLVLKAIAVIFALWWLSSSLVRATDNRLRRIKEMRDSNRILIVKLFQIVLYCFAFVFGMQLLGISLTALSVFSGALGVGIGFGLQKIASNFISGIILLFERSIELGSMIELPDGTVGFIRQTRARYSLLETTDGRDVLIPNEEFINQRVVSWTYSNKLARAEVTVSVSYESDLALARQLMLDIANNHPKRDASRQTVCVIHEFADSGVVIRLLFWVRDVTDGRMEPRSEVMIDILRAFKANNIAIPYPRREVVVTHVNDTGDLQAGMI